MGLGFKRWACIVSVVSSIMLAIAGSALVAARAGSEHALLPTRQAFVYLFDPPSARFIFTFTLPTPGADPQDIVVVPGAGSQQVWFTEAGIDRIGHLTYTSTQLYAFREYTLTAGSRPLNIAASGGAIWFTQAGRNRIGRLDPASGALDEFQVPTANSFPADLDVAPDGSIWFTEMASGKIGHLVVASLTHTITEYFSLQGGQPYGIVVVGGSVYFAQTAADRVTQFTPPDRWVHIKGFVSGIPDEPYRLVHNAGQVWGTERAGNAISQFDYGTLPIIARYGLSPNNSMPTGLAADANHHLWFTQWQAGQIGRLIPGGTPQKDYYPLPSAGLAPGGIATDSAGRIWVTATRRTYTVYLPVIARCWNATLPPFGIQFYTSLDASTGLEYAAQARARWIRWPVAWSTVEPSNTTPDNYRWNSIDASVLNATASNINLILTISGQPTWAAVYPMGPVTDTADLTEFVGALVERYDGDGLDDAPGSPRVRYFELYNEPDNTTVGAARRGGVGYWGYNGTGYAELLRALYPIVKAASPQAQLVSGGVAMDWFVTEGGPFDPDFLQDVLAACQGYDCFDVMNFHYYPPFRPRWEPYGADIIGKATYIRQLMAQYGFADRPLICTETGWAGGTDWGNDELQSRYVVKGFVRGAAANLPIIVWYTISDISDVSLPGLLTAQLEPKPSYYAFQNLTTRLTGAVYLRPLTSDETGSNSIVGYVFEKCGQRIDVVWTEDETPYNADDDPTLPMTVNAATVRLVDKYGDAQILQDGEDGSTDGRITFQVGGSPLYVEYNP